MGAVTYPTLEHVAMQARPYPTHLLEGCKTGLCLFAAAFLGHNDAVHFAEAGINTVCIDTDGVRLREMEALYPSDWEFYEADAWDFVQGKAGWVGGGLPNDVVSVDTFTGDIMHRSLESLELWCSLARYVVTVTITEDAMPLVTPMGWESSYYPRATGVYWLVLTRD